MTRTFTLAEARALLPEVLEQSDALVSVRADLAERVHAHNRGDHGPLAEVKALEARMSELLDWFPARGIQVKGYAPLLIDFPASQDGRDILLCWLEGEPELAWYHDPALGFMGRRPLTDLT